MTNVYTHFDTNVNNCNMDEGHVFTNIEDGGLIAWKCSDLNKNECSGSGINTDRQSINKCKFGFWFWEDDCIDDPNTECSIQVPTVIDPNSGERKLKYSRNFTNKDYAQLCSWAANSETNSYIKTMRNNEPVKGRPKNPDIFATDNYPLWSNGQNMCSSAGLEKIQNFKAIEELELDCNKRTKDSCEKVEGAPDLYPTKTGGGCYWIDENNDSFDRGCWQYNEMCSHLTSKESCESHPSHLCWWDTRVLGLNKKDMGLCTKYSLLEDTYLNTTDNVPRSDYWFDAHNTPVNWKQQEIHYTIDGKIRRDCVPTNEPLKKGEVFSGKIECDNYFYGRSICDRQTLTCSEETINYSDKDETYSSKNLCNKNCKAEFACFANESGVKVCRQIGVDDKKPSKTYDSLDECNEGTNYCNDRRWDCITSNTPPYPKECGKLNLGIPGYSSKEECEEKSYCGNPPAPRFACLNTGKGKECSQLPSGSVFEPSYTNLENCQIESNYCGNGPPIKWGCLNTGKGKECSLYPEGADSPYNTKEECERGTNFCKLLNP